MRTPAHAHITHTHTQTPTHKHTHKDKDRPMIKLTSIDAAPHKLAENMHTNVLIYTHENCLKIKVEGAQCFIMIMCVCVL